MKMCFKKGIAAFMIVMMAAWALSSNVPAPVSAANAGYVRPTPAQILSDLSTATAASGAARPRIMLDAVKLQQLKRDCITAPVEPYKSWYKTLKTSADNACKSSTKYITMNDLSNLAAMNRIMILSFAYMMTTDSSFENGDEKYKTRLYNEITSLDIDWSALSDSKFLSVSVLLQSFGIAYDWVYNGWTDAEKVTLKNLMLGGLGQAESLYREIISGQKSAPAGLISSAHNWNICGNAGIGISSLALMDEADTSEFASWMLSECLKIMENNHQHLTGGTGYIEGAGYSQFLMRYFTMFLSSLKYSTGKDYGFLSAPGMNKLAYYVPAMVGAQDIASTLDSNEGAAADMPEPFFFAKMYNDPVLASYRVQQLKQTKKNTNVRDVLWYEPPSYYGQTDSYDTIFRTSYPRDGYFSNPEDATFRNGFWDADTSYILLGGGKNNVNHGQIDAGSFIYESQGVRWAIDLGKENDSVTNYWSYSNKENSRWTYYRCRAEGHNTFVINPSTNAKLPADQNLTNNIPVTEFVSTPQMGKAVVNMAPAYPDHVNSATRTMVFDKATGGVVLTDDIVFKTASGNTLYWFMHTRAAITIAPDGRSATLVQDGKTLEVKALDGNSTFTKMNAVKLPGMPASPAASNSNKGVTKLVISNTNAGGAYQIKVSMQVKDAPLYPIDLEPLAPRLHANSHLSIESDEAIANVSFVNTLPEGQDKTVTVILGCYSKGNKLVDVVTKTYTVNAGEPEFYDTLGLPIADEDTAKLLVWDFTESMQPLLAAKKLVNSYLRELSASQGNGSMMINGVTDADMELALVVRDAEGTIVYLDQILTDSDGSFVSEFPLEEYGGYVAAFGTTKYDGVTTFIFDYLEP